MQAMAVDGVANAAGAHPHKQGHPDKCNQTKWKPKKACCNPKDGRQPPPSKRAYRVCKLVISHPSRIPPSPSVQNLSETRHGGDYESLIAEVKRLLWVDSGHMTVLKLRGGQTCRKLVHKCGELGARHFVGFPYSAKRWIAQILNGGRSHLPEEIFVQ